MVRIATTCVVSPSFPRARFPRSLPAMAHVVCQVIGRSDRVGLTWSEGGGSFDPYEIGGQAFLNFKALALAARERLSDLVKEYLSGTDGDVRRAAFELA